VETVDRLRADEDGGVEAEGVVGRREVVVYRLRDADHRKVVLRIEPRSDAERVLAADRDERVEALALEVREHRLDAVELVGIRTRRAQDRPAARQQARALPRPERLELCPAPPPPPFPPSDHFL